MQVDYKPFVDRMIDRYEGGYGWNRKDPGGPTKYGVTCYDLAMHRGQKMNSMAEWAPIVKAMTRAEAEEIYAAKYAVAVLFDQLPAGVDVVMLDYAVNSGIGRPVRVARALLNQGTGDRMTPALADAIKAADPKWFVDAMCVERLHFMHSIRGGSAWEEFGKGWGARVADLKAYGEHLVDAAAGVPVPAPPVAPDLSNVPTPKASHEDPNLVKNVTTGTVVVNTGQATAQASAGVPYWAIGAVVAFVFIGGVVYVVWKQARNDKKNATVVIPAGVAHAATI